MDVKFGAITKFLYASPKPKTELKGNAPFHGLIIDAVKRRTDALAHGRDIYTSTQPASHPDFGVILTGEDCRRFRDTHDYLDIPEQSDLDIGRFRPHRHQRELEAYVAGQKGLDAEGNPVQYKFVFAPSKNRVKTGPDDKLSQPA